MSSRLSDTEFLYQFETQTLDPKHFDHKGHLRLGWLYLQSHTLPIAKDLACENIRQYAESLGAHEKFHKTITISIIDEIAKRLSHNKSASFQDFLKHNEDLVADCLGILLKKYSKNRLFSEDARLRFIEADLIE